MNEKENFAFRCLNLNCHFDAIKENGDFSDREWVSVLTKILSDLIMRQQNPDKASEQVIDLIKAMKLSLEAESEKD